MLPKLKLLLTLNTPTPSQIPALPSLSLRLQVNPSSPCVSCCPLLISDFMPLSHLPFVFYLFLLNSRIWLWLEDWVIQRKCVMTNFSVILRLLHNTFNFIDEETELQETIHPTTSHELRTDREINTSIWDKSRQVCKEGKPRVLPSSLQTNYGFSQ